MAPEAASAQSSVVLASFESRRAAEHMLASLRRGLRTKARKGHVYTLLRISIAIAIGFLGLFSAAKGAKGGVHEAHTRKSHVGSDDERVHELIANAGPHAAILLASCDDQ